jgi:hypothetical protein
VAVTTLKRDKVAAAICRRCGRLASVALTAAIVVSSPAVITAAANRRIVLENMGILPVRTPL